MNEESIIFDDGFKMTNKEKKDVEDSMKKMLNIIKWFFVGCVCGISTVWIYGKLFY